MFDLISLGGLFVKHSKKLKIKIYCNKSLTSSVLYMPIITPPVPLNSNTSVDSLPLPSAGVKEISNTPGPSTAKSLARYCEQVKPYSQTLSVLIYIVLL